MTFNEDSVRALLKRQLEPHGWRVGGPVAAENSSGGGASSTREVDVLCIRPDGAVVAVEVKPGRLASNGDTWTHNKQLMQKPPICRQKMQHGRWSASLLTARWSLVQRCQLSGRLLRRAMLQASSPHRLIEIAFWMAQC